MAVTMRSRDGQAHAQPPAASGWRRKVFDETGPDGGRVVEPALAGRARWARAPRCCCTARARRATSSAVKEHELIGAGAGAPVHTVGLVPVHPATYGLPASVAARAGLGPVRRHPPRRGAAARGAARGRAPARPAGGAGGGRTSPTPRRTRPAPAGGWPSRSCTCPSWRWPAGAAPAAARARRRPRGGRRLAGRPVGGRAAVRADRRPGGRGRRDRAPTWPPRRRCSGC